MRQSANLRCTESPRLHFGWRQAADKARSWTPLLDSSHSPWRVQASRGEGFRSPLCVSRSQVAMFRCHQVTRTQYYPGALPRRQADQPDSASCRSCFCPCCAWLWRGSVSSSSCSKQLGADVLQQVGSAQWQFASVFCARISVIRRAQEPDDDQQAGRT